MPGWYEEAIEEPIRDLVRLLRDNGFNTFCSCGHKMYVQCSYLPDGEIQRLHDLLFVHFYDKMPIPPEYDITMHLHVADGHVFEPLLTIQFPVAKGRGRKQD